MSNFRKFAQGWTFFRLVHDFRQPDPAEPLSSEAGEHVEGQTAGEQSLAKAAGKGRGQAQETLQELLQKLRSQKPAMDVIKDVLHEETIKQKAWMPLV